MPRAGRSLRIRFACCHACSSRHEFKYVLMQEFVGLTMGAPLCNLQGLRTWRAWGREELVHVAKKTVLALRRGARQANVRECMQFVRQHSA